MGSDLIQFPPTTESAELAAERAKVADLEKIVRELRHRVSMPGSVTPELEACRLQLRDALGIQPDAVGNFSWPGLVSRTAAIRATLTNETWRADRAEADLLAVRGTMTEISKVLGCGREVPQIFDAITRLKEQNSTLTSETASALVVERRAHADTKVQLGQFQYRVVEAIRNKTEGRLALPVGSSVIKIVEDLADEWLLRSRQLDELRDKLGALDAGVEEEDEPEAQECSLCLEDTDMITCDDCTRCDECHDKHGCGLHVEDGDGDRAEDGVSPAVASLKTAVATSSRDWAATPGDAWIYGVVIGWDDASLTELAARFGWKQATLDYLAALHDAMEAG